MDIDCVWNIARLEAVEVFDQLVGSYRVFDFITDRKRKLYSARYEIGNGDTSRCFVDNERCLIVLSREHIEIAREGGTFLEYSMFERDSEIGSYCGTFAGFIGAVFAHELAHAIHFYGNFLVNGRKTTSEILAERMSYDKELKLFKKDPKRENSAPHGAAWRTIYRFLRPRVLKSIEENLAKSTVPASRLIKVHGPEKPTSSIRF